MGRDGGRWERSGGWPPSSALISWCVCSGACDTAPSSTAGAAPADEDDAHRMLGRLSGGWHSVTSAWELRWRGPEACPTTRERIHGSRTSRVKFRHLTDVEIACYIRTGEGYDKAGGYAVQGEGAALIERVVGSTTNVVGLPLDSVIPALLTLGIARRST